MLIHIILLPYYTIFHVMYILYMTLKTISKSLNHVLLICKPFISHQAMRQDKTHSLSLVSQAWDVHPASWYLLCHRHLQCHTVLPTGHVLTSAVLQMQQKIIRRISGINDCLDKMRQVITDINPTLNALVNKLFMFPCLLI